LNLNKFITADQLPKTVNVCDFEVGLTLCDNTSSGVLLNTYQSRSILRQLIINNCENTGFVLSFLSYSIGCIFKPSKTSKYVYCLVVYDETKSHQAQYIKNINGVDSVVDEIVILLSSYIQFPYCFKFIPRLQSCPFCNMLLLVVNFVCAFFNIPSSNQNILNTRKVDIYVSYSHGNSLAVLFKNSLKHDFLL